MTKWCAAGIKVSLATVYNTLHQFTGAGLLRQVIVDAARGYFDTNTGDHQHFFLEEEGALIDIPGENRGVGRSHAAAPAWPWTGWMWLCGFAAPDRRALEFSGIPPFLILELF